MKGQLIEERLKKITNANLNHFLFGRIQKAKFLLKLIYEFKETVKWDEFVLARMKFRDLEL